MEGSYIINLNRIVSEDPELCNLIYYPVGDLETCIERIRLLDKRGIEALLLEGEAFVYKYHTLGKGTNSIVLKVLHNHTVKVLKILRADADRNTLEHEAKILSYINDKEREYRIKIVPKLYDHDKWFLLMEYIEGSSINDFLSSELYSLAEDEVKRLVYKILFKCHILDLIGVDHGEISNPYKHIIITEDLEPIIIDFESASMIRKPKNLTSIFQFIFYTSNASSFLRTIFNLDYQSILPMLKKYKKTPSRELFNKIIDHMGLI